MRQILFYLVLISSAHAGFRPGAPSPSLAQICPDIRVNCPVYPPKPGEPVTFTADITGGDPRLSASLTYKWSVSAGTITNGQGTLEITVDTVGMGGQSLTATLEVNGINADCQKIASCTAAPYCPVLSRKFDEYGDISLKEEKVRLDYLAIQLQNEPGAQGYIFAYGPRAGEAQARAARAKDWLVSYYDYEPERIVAVNGGYRKNREVEIWLTPTGATPPTPTPDVAPDKTKTRKGAAKRN